MNFTFPLLFYNAFKITKKYIRKGNRWSYASSYDVVDCYVGGGNDDTVIGHERRPS